MHLRHCLTPVTNWRMCIIGSHPFITFIVCILFVRVSFRRTFPIVSQWTKSNVLLSLQSKRLQQYSCIGVERRRASYIACLYLDVIHLVPIRSIACDHGYGGSSSPPVRVTSPFNAITSLHTWLSLTIIFRMDCKLDYRT